MAWSYNTAESTSVQEGMTFTSKMTFKQVASTEKGMRIEFKYYEKRNKTTGEWMYGEDFYLMDSLTPSYKVKIGFFSIDPITTSYKSSTVIQTIPNDFYGRQVDIVTIFRDKVNVLFTIPASYFTPTTSHDFKINYTQNYTYTENVVATRTSSPSGFGSIGTITSNTIVYRGDVIKFTGKVLNGFVPRINNVVSTYYKNEDCTVIDFTTTVGGDDAIFTFGSVPNTIGVYEYDGGMYDFNPYYLYVYDENGWSRYRMVMYDNGEWTPVGFYNRR